MDSYFPNSQFEADLPEDTSPEVRELACVVWELGRLLHVDSPFGGQEPRKRCRDVLPAIIRDSPKSTRLTTMLDGKDYLTGGDEHHILRVEADPGRVYKFTHGDNFGCSSFFSPADPELKGNFHGETNGDPFFYLSRWLILNTFSDYQTRFEGFVPAQKPGWVPRICVSQPEIPGLNPTPSEIRKSLGAFSYAEVSENAYFSPETEILLTDAAPRNVRVVDGIPVPFDAIAQFAEGRVLEWCLGRIR